ncbi:28S ribosomal protein S15, mitochondrial-like [Ctenocephalides felis]|uniref:28S ribosomal protein S15, mitochondrial-like n=1 Tax=Ctenocephalides felis TaxID=7515 RepID=UPI000E6E4EA7|nr:28S ribosomal protein S15, mitochondrial-like [Ctenocephalides felis]
MNTIYRFACQGNVSLIKRFIPSTRTFKSDLKIKWVRPEKIPCIDPRKSGDVEPVMYPNSKKLPLEFKDSDIVSNVEESVLDMFSIGKSRRRLTCELTRENMKDRVRRHKYDESSRETRSK